jgi:N-carbamoyl-L-amino-acid hydrolase
VRSHIERLEAREAVAMDAALREGLYRAAASLGEQPLAVASGAGHDAMCLARVAPAAMLFVPSIGGLSHVPDERTAEKDLELGVNVLARWILEVDRLLRAH